MDRARSLATLRRTGRLAWRVARVLLWAVLGLVAVLVLTLLLPPARRGVLNMALDHVVTLAPGQASVGRADWPRLGRLELYDVRWADADTMLAEVDSLAAAVDLGDLVRRDVTVDQVLIAGVRADVPAIMRRLPAPAPAPADTTAPDAPPAFPRPGALAPIPSLALSSLELRRIDVTVAPGQAVVLDHAQASADLRHGRPLAFSLAFRAHPLDALGVAWRLSGGQRDDHFELTLTPLTLTHPEQLPPLAELTDSGRLAMPMAELRHLAGGRLDWPRLELDRLAIVGDLGQWTLDASLDGRGPGRVTLRSELPRLPIDLLAEVVDLDQASFAAGWQDTLASRWSNHGVPGLELVIDLTPPAAPAPPWQAKVAVRGQVALPGPAALAPLLPPALRVDDLGALLAELSLDVDGAATPPAARLHLDLGATPWLDAAVIAAHGDTSRAVLDSLAVRLPGLSLTASGQADRQGVDLDAHLVLPDASLAARWDDPLLADLTARADVRLRAAGAWPIPTVQLAAEAAVEMPLATVPQLTLAATVSPDTLLIDVALPDGMSSGANRIDRFTLEVDGAPGPDWQSAGARLRLDAGLPQASLYLDTRADARDFTGQPSGTVRIDTLAVGVADLRLSSTAPCTLQVASADSSLSLSRLHLAGDLGLIDVVAHATPDSLAAALNLDLALALDALRPLLPEPSQAMLPSATLTLTGQADVSGTPATPGIRSELRLGFRDHEDLATLAAVSDLDVARDARLTLTLLAADSSLVSLSARAPRPMPDAAADTLDVALDARQADLALLQPLLPPGIDLRGRLSADPHLWGLYAMGDLAPDLAMDGGLSLDDLRVDLPDGSWMAMDGSVDLSGTTIEPVIRGGLTIEGGLIRLPEPPPVLLPTSGEAMLWSAAPAVPDTALADAEVDTSTSALAAILPDLEFKVRAPGGLWLRGQGLDVELVGDLVLRMQGGAPALEGELNAANGTMRQLGHVFNLERGRVVFYADEGDLDPELDLALGVKIKGVAIKIILSGTANQPDLAFQSDPEMSDGDIISLLLFGFTSDELDEGQAGLLAERAGELAAAYGSVALQERVAKELGVDVLTIAPSSGDDEATSLTVGKYLNPKVLVRYEQVLDDESAFFVHLDYAFWNDFKLHNQVSQGSDSGIELKWERDW
jgi:hypothetical protein